MLKDIVKEIIADCLEEKVQSLGDDVGPNTHERWDSMMHLNIVVALEEKFSLSFEPQEMGKMVNLASICAMIEAKKK